MRKTLIERLQDSIDSWKLEAKRYKDKYFNSEIRYKFLVRINIATLISSILLNILCLVILLWR